MPSLLLAILLLAQLAPETSIPEQGLVLAAHGEKIDSAVEWRDGFSQVQVPSLSLFPLASEAYAEPQPRVGSNHSFFQPFMVGNPCSGAKFEEVSGALFF